jgi:hypothetical protein
VASQAAIMLAISHAAPPVITAMAAFHQAIGLMTPQTMVMFGIGHAAAPIVATVAAFHQALGFMAAQTVIVLGIGHTATSVVASVAAFHQAFGFVAPETMVMFGIGHTAAPIVSAMARLIKPLRFLSAQPPVVLGISYAPARTATLFFRLPAAAITTTAVTAGPCAIAFRRSACPPFARAIPALAFFIFLLACIFESFAEFSDFLRVPVFDFVRHLYGRISKPRHDRADAVSIRIILVERPFQNTQIADNGLRTRNFDFLESFFPALDFLDGSIS